MKFNGTTPKGTQRRLATSRRNFLTRGAQLTALSGLGRKGEVQAHGKPEALETFYKVVPVGRVEIQGPTVRVRVFEEYAGALLGLDGWSHVNVLYWFDKNDVPEKRRILQVHPRGDRSNPLTGVFACRAPVRPNLIALTVCRILSVENPVVTLDKIDAFDGTPVLDLKPFIPPDSPIHGVRVPQWLGPGK